jgi:hypothetical protein
VSVVVRYQPAGLTRQQYDEVNRRLEGSAAWPPDGMDMHVMFGTEGDLRVSEIWDSEEQWRAFADTLLPVLNEVGVRMGGDPEVFQVHELAKRDAAHA